jgi:UDP-galactopyranose mutase
VQDDRIKTCFTHDLWGLPVAKELHEQAFSRIPVQFMMSERWVKDVEVGPVTRGILHYYIFATCSSLISLS